MSKVKARTFQVGVDKKVTFIEVAGNILVGINMTVDECVRELERAAKEEGRRND